MLTPSIPQFRRRRGRRKGATPAAVPALVLVGATYEHHDPPFVVLGFDRAIDIDLLAGSAIQVDDGTINSIRYEATGGAEVVTPTTLKLFLVEIEPTPGTQTVLDASPDNGIVAADDGAAWAGVTNLALPFP